ncbi:MAG: tetratricopeptide repeat protein [Nitrospiraceae bacterium]|nr:tetratricopeptide repeat protein [Nitrospiraceae bacterium]
MMTIKRPILLFVFLAIISPLFSRPSFGADVTFIKEYTYMASDIDSKVSCRAIALEQVKRALLEQLGTYIISETEVKNYQITKEQVFVLTAGIVSAEVIDEKWDGRSYYLKAKISADPKEVAKSIDGLRKDKQKSKELEESKQKAEEAMKEVERLKKDLEFVKLDAKKQSEYNSAIRDLSETEWYDRGIALVQSHDFQGASDAFTKAIELNPQYAKNYMVRGLTYIGLRNHNKAIADFNIAIKLTPKDASAYFWRAQAFIAEDNQKNAMDDFDKAIQLSPTYAEAYYLRGDTYCRLGIIDRAMQDLNRALQLKSNYLEAYLGRGECFLYQKKYARAIEDLNRVIKSEPRNDRAYLMRGLTYDQIGNYKKSVADLTIAAKLGNKIAQDALKEQNIEW